MRRGTDHLLAAVLTAVLVFAGALNLVPDAHPDAARDRPPAAALAPRQEEPPDHPLWRFESTGHHPSGSATRWFRHHPTDDLAPLVEAHGHALSVRYGPYLWLGEHFGNAELVAYPNALTSGMAPRGRAREELIDELPVRFLDVMRLEAFTALVPVTCPYAPRLSAEEADILRRRAAVHAQWETGRPYLIVPLSTTGADPKARVRIMVHAGALFFVAEGVGPELDLPTGEDSC